MIKNREIHTSYIVNNIPYNKIYMVLEYFTRKNVVSLQLILIFEVEFFLIYASKDGISNKIHSFRGRK